MSKSTSIGIHKLYSANPIKADKLLWGRETDHSRRGFLKKAGLATMSLFLGAEIVYAQFMPAGLIPAWIFHSDEDFTIEGKDKGLKVLNDRPLSAETPPHLLDDSLTPLSKLFVRNNGIPPTDTDPAKWVLNIGGESVKKEISFTFEELKSKFKHYTYQLTLECAGNGRHEFDPPAKGNQWSLGAVGCPEWTGVRLRDVLEAAGIKDDAVYVAYKGKDTHLSSEVGKLPISRGVPMSKALEDESLIAWAMNGEDIPVMNGYPLRLIFGGWPGSTSGKWLSEIMIRNKVHDGPKMNGQSYKVPCEPISPGAEIADEDMCIIESMPVKSMITYPKTGGLLQDGQSLDVRGHAWAGDLSVKEMFISIDFGTTWIKCDLKAAKNRLAWQDWSTKVNFPKKGYYEVWARATDSKGQTQSMLVPGWNPKGYLNNACHRIGLKVV